MARLWIVILTAFLLVVCPWGPSVPVSTAEAGNLPTTPSWTAEGNQAGAGFGFAVACAGDVNGDGYDDIIVGAQFYTSGQTSEGRASLYCGSASGVSATAAWHVEGNQDSAWLGYSVAGAGDVNNDGYDDVVVGVPFYEGLAYGKVLVFHGSATGLPATPSWTAIGAQLGTQFGFSVASAGDVNGDGYDDIIVGDKSYSGGQSKEGRAYVYHGSATGLASAAAWTAESNQAQAYLGYSVSGAGDVNNDGYDDVIVGLHQYSNGQSQEGGAWVYHGSASGLGTTTAWTAESNQAGAFFGSAVSGAGDVNGDGYADVIIGAWQYTASYANEGRAYVYHGSASGLTPVSAASVDGGRAGARLGYSVGSAGNVDADLYDDVIIGAPGWENYANDEGDEGMACVYRGQAGGLSSVHAWQVEGTQGGAMLGCAVSTAGDVNGDGYSDVIVGQNWYDGGQVDEGRALVFTALPIAVIPSSPGRLTVELNTAAFPFLQWVDASDNETQFRIERRTAAEEEFMTVGTSPMDWPQYTDAETEPGTTYYYRVRACGSAGESEPSNEVSIATPGAGESPPGDDPGTDGRTGDDGQTDESPDIRTASAWAQAEIQQAWEYGLTTERILSDYQTSITREEFCEVVVLLYEKLSGLAAQPVSPNPFVDTDNPEILKAFGLGITKGVAPDRFAPNNHITRQEICVMLFRTLRATNPELTTEVPSSEPFADESLIASWAIDGVRFCHHHQIMKGIGPNEIGPLANTTREQAILLVKRTYEAFRQ